MSRPSFPALAALSVPAYRRIWSAILISNMGIWMQITGRAFLVYDITGSTSALGIVYLASYGPQLFVGPFAGVLADRYDRRKTVMLTAIGMALASAAIGALATTGTATLANVAAISLVTGVLQTVTQASSMALLPSLVSKPLLHSAVSLQALTSSGTRVVGPLLAGGLIPIVGVAWLFYLNALSLLPVVVAWWRTKVPQQQADVQGRPLRAVAEGFAFTRRTRPLAVPVSLLAVLSAVGLVYQPLGVAYATEVLADGGQQLGATYFGLLQGAIGAGALLGVLALSGVSQRRPAGTLIGTGVVFSLSLMALGLTGMVAVAVPLAVVLGAAHFANSNLTLALAQHHAPEEMRGRVMALTLVAFVGIFPFTSYGFGALADVVGSGITFFACGVVCLLASLLVVRWRRDIYIPEVDEDEPAPPEQEAAADQEDAPAGRQDVADRSLV